MKWLLAIAQMNALSNGRFIGNIDDLRIFNKAISLSEHQSFYNQGKGDLNLAVLATYPTATHRNPISIDLNFTRYGMPWSVDFNQTMLGLNNAILHEDVNTTARSSFRIELNSTVDPGIVGVSLPAWIAKDSSLTGNNPLFFNV